MMMFYVCETHGEYKPLGSRSGECPTCIMDRMKDDKPTIRAPWYVERILKLEAALKDLILAVEKYAQSGLIEAYTSDRNKSLSDVVDDASEALAACTPSDGEKK